MGGRWDGRGARGVLGRVLLHATVAVVLTAPLAWHLDRLPTGREPDPTVARFNLWTLRWTADRLPHALAGWWDAPIFWPTRGTFAFSEPQPLTGVAFAAVRPFVGDVGAYSLLVLAALTLTGLAAAALARRLGARAVAAVGVGVLAQGLPFVFDQFGVLQLVMVWPIFASLAALLAWCERPDQRRAVLAGLGLAAVALTCGYYAALLGLALFVAGPVLVEPDWAREPDQRARRVGGALIVVSVAGVLTAPLLLGQLDRLSGRRWLDTTVLAGSARWSDWLPSGDLWPGTVLVGLAVVGVVLGRGRRTTWFFVVLGAAAVAASLGRRLTLGGLRPWDLLADHVGIIARLRSPFRAAVLVEVALVALAVPALDRLVADRRRLVRLAAPALVVAALVPAGSGVSLLEPVPDRPAWASWLDERPDGLGVVWLPFAPGTSTRAFGPTVDAMLAALDTGHPLVNGYSGFFPFDHAERREQLAGFPDAASLEALASWDVAYAVVDRAWLNAEGREAAARRAGLVVVEEDRSAVLLALRSK